MAVLAALLSFCHVFVDFRSHDLARLVGNLLGAPYSQRQATYDLRRLLRKRLILAGMAALCETARVPFMLLVMPDFSQDFRRDPYGGVIHARVNNWGARHGVTVVDLLSRLAHADSSALRVEGDGHPNAAGQRLIAEALRAELERVVRQGLVPEVGVEPTRSGSYSGF